MKITGERVVTPTGAFNPTWQRHAAAYALSAPSLGPGKVLDLGSGIGHGRVWLEPRETVGVDIDPQAAAGSDLATVVADMRELPFDDGSFASVVAIHSVEHVPDPERVVAEAARVLARDGVAVFVTPNRLTFGRPDEIIDPYHHVELGPEELRALCGRAFGEVELLGLFGSERYMALFTEERAKLGRLLRWDPLRLRRVAPRRFRKRAYDVLLRRYRGEDDARGKAIEVSDFELRDSGLDACLDVCAFCGAPLVHGR